MADIDDIDIDIDQTWRHIHTTWHARHLHRVGLFVSCLAPPGRTLIFNTLSHCEYVRDVCAGPDASPDVESCNCLQCGLDIPGELLIDTTCRPRTHPHTYGLAKAFHDRDAPVAYGP